MLKNISLKAKLTSLLLIISIIPLIVIGLIGYSIAHSSFEEKAFDELKAVQQIKKTQIESFFSERLNDAKLIASTTDVILAAKELIQYHKEMKIKEDEKYDITGNYAWLSKSYSEIDADIDLLLHKYVAAYGYDDLFMVCYKHGHIMWSDASKSDLGENLSEGRLKSSNIATLWKKVVDTKKAAIVDMAWYEPSNEPAVDYYC